MDCLISRRLMKDNGDMRAPPTPVPAPVPQTSCIIALTGPIGSGKTHAASLLAQRGFTKLSFAEPLKQIAGVLGFDTSPEAKDVTSPMWGIPPRLFYQVFGTEVCRDHVPFMLPSMASMWIRLMAKRIDILHTAASAAARACCIVIDDLRFEDEEKFLRDIGASIVRTGSKSKRSVQAASYVLNEACEGPCSPTYVRHVSEEYEPEYDYVLPAGFTINHIDDMLAALANGPAAEPMCF